MAFQRDLKCEGVTEKNDTIVQLSNECVDLLPSLVHFCTCFVLEEKREGINVFCLFPHLASYT